MVLNVLSVCNDWVFNAKRHHTSAKRVQRYAFFATRTPFSLGFFQNPCINPCRRRCRHLSSFIKVWQHKRLLSVSILCHNHTVGLCDDCVFIPACQQSLIVERVYLSLQLPDTPIAIFAFLHLERHGLNNLVTLCNDFTALFRLIHYCPVPTTVSAYSLYQFVFFESVYMLLDGTWCYPDAFGNFLSCNLRIRLNQLENHVGRVCLTTFLTTLVR